MATKKKLLQAAAGTAAASGGAGALNVEDVFSTYLYEGNGVGKRIENGINLGDGTEEETIIHLTGDSITDSGPNSISLTNSGVVSSSSIKKFGTASLYFDANSSTRLTATDPSLNLGGGDYTVEMWLYINDASGTKGIFALSNPSDDTVYDIGMFHSSNGLTWQSRYTPVSYKSYPSNSNAITNSTWHHVALVRYNNYHYMYIDGTLQGTPVDVTGQATGWNHLKLGTHWDNAYCFTGRIDEFRVTRKALYTANFTPPTAAFSTSYTSTTGEGGLVWIKERDATSIPVIYDTERGVGKLLRTNDTNAETDLSASSLGITAYNSNGFSLGGTTNNDNDSGINHASWTFRKAPKFFDVVTYTGNGTSGRTVSHNLGSVPGCIIVKRTDTTGSWRSYHTSLGATKYIDINSTSAAGTSNTSWADTEPTSTEITLGSSANVNASGGTYVAYLFAHNDGDGTFGPTGDQDVIRCGSYTGNGSADGPEIDLGFEPQWLLYKNTSTGGSAWVIVDNMRGITTGGDDALLQAQSSGAELSSGYNYNDLQANGFKVTTTADGANTNGDTYIYIAIRRGPMAVPTDATDVFAPVYASSSGEYSAYLGNPVDLALYNSTAGSAWAVFDRLRGTPVLSTDTTGAETSSIGAFDSNTSFYLSGVSGDYSAYINYVWKRAPSFCDVVAYTGNSTAGRTVSHNLGVAPEMMWIKSRSNSDGWYVYHKDTGATKYLTLNSSSVATTDTWINNTAPTDSVFTLGGSGSGVNYSGLNYIAYLFASLDGVSKVGSVTVSGSDVNVDCGFSNGARFVLMKKTSGTGDWFLIDTERGLVSGSDPYLSLNSTAAESSAYDLLDPYSAGFTVVGPSFGTGTWIYYAIA